MPIKIPNDLPASKILKEENIFVMDETRALSQRIRPLKLIIVNIMPTKIVTETQLLRLLSNTPLQIEVDWLCMESHNSKNTPQEHLMEFYKTFNEIKDNKYDLKCEVGTTSDYYKSTNGDFIVHCQVKEGNTNLIELNVAVPLESQADAMCARWRDASQDIYDFVMNKLM